jgi:hypothetical protein
MPVGSGALVRQIAGRGCFARVRLEVTPSEAPGRVEVAEGVALDRWFLPAVEVGVNYAWERLLLEGQKPPQVLVRVLELATSTVDTSVLMVVYVSALALCDGLSMSLRAPIEIDLQNRRLSFAL